MNYLRIFINYLLKLVFGLSLNFYFKSLSRSVTILIIHKQSQSYRCCRRFYEKRECMNKNTGPSTRTSQKN